MAKKKPGNAAAKNRRTGAAARNRRGRAAARNRDKAAKKEGTADKKEGTAPKKPETAAIELATELYSQLQLMLASPPTLSSSQVAEFQRTFSGIMNSATSITKLPFITNGNGTTGYSNGNYSDLGVQYLEYKNSRLKDLIIELLLKK